MGLTAPLSPQCPVYDLDNNVAFIGMYQTMTKKAAITVQVGTGLCCEAVLWDWVPPDPCLVLPGTAGYWSPQRMPWDKLWHGRFPAGLC